MSIIDICEVFTIMFVIAVLKTIWDLTKPDDDETGGSE